MTRRRDEEFPRHSLQGRCENQSSGMDYVDGTDTCQEFFARPF